MSAVSSDMVFAYRDPDRHPVKRQRINNIVEETSAAGVILYSNLLAKDSGVKVDNITGLGTVPQTIEIAGARVHYGVAPHYAAIGVTSSLGATPTPASNVATLWQTDGTTNVDGDFLTTVNNGSTTATNVLVPHSRYYQSTYTTSSDLNYNGTTNVLITDCTLSLPKGTFLVGYKFTVLANSTNISIGTLVEDPSGTPADTAGSVSASSGSNGSRRMLHKVFPLTVGSATDYQLGFRSSGSGSGVGVDMVIGAGQADPDTCPTVWAVQIA